MPTFEALMDLASKQTKESQIAFAKENQIRQAREKVKRLEEERKEKERIRLEKERLAKKKLEDEKREKQLIEERQRRQADRLSTAEQTRKQQDSDSTNRASSSRMNNGPSPSSRHRSTTRPSSSTPTNFDVDPEEKRRLEREEKQAKARAKLFGESVAAHKKPTPSRSSANTSQRTNPSSKGKAPMRGTASGNNSKIALGTPATITARQRIEQTFSASERKPLSQTKRDRRTIEEIEQDMKRKKIEVGTQAIRPSKETSFSSSFTEKRILIPLKPVASSSTLREANKNPRPRSETVSAVKRKAINGLPTPSSKRPQLPTSLPKDSKPNGSRPLPQSRSGSHSGRRQDATVSDEDDDSSDSEEMSEHGEDVAPSVRDEIWKIMGKDRRQYTAKPIFSDEEDDMEADADDVLEEEGRAARLARLEDQREEERLRQHELEKKKRLLQRRLSK
ncbi:hypothetical protein PGT21_004661 [Puccinia graminis f. sp. tritici]|uniref:SPT2 chromatin protein n=1 Tax=Puccinia graminis f. sp. tritici TaxID=56615 RepID=A0A5B0M0A6_PUCGR|nr:hypothetical protein PGT21_004661 [Puccinia graminis f. sp. tritici]KAA1090166.1 hypothetical protein PGTUg99_036741 [Puccinia graminis f. sp. tritici]